MLKGAGSHAKYSFKICWIWLRPGTGSWRARARSPLCNAGPCAPELLFEGGPVWLGPCSAASSLPPPATGSVRPPEGFVHRVWLWARALARAYAGPRGAQRLLCRHPWLRPHIGIFVDRDLETFLASARWSQVEAWWGRCPPHQSHDRPHSSPAEVQRRWTAIFACAPPSANLFRAGVAPCDLVWAMAVLGIL